MEKTNSELGISRIETKMDTQVWKADAKSHEELLTQVTQAAELLSLNEVVAFPTETVYGLGGNALSNVALSKIFQAKGRPSDNPLIVHVARVQQFRELVTEVPALVETIIEAFWPGPLTVVLPCQSHIASKCTGGQTTVGVRIPDHPVALALLEACGLPIAAPSANTSGKPSPTAASHVVQDLAGKIAGVVDAGATGVGVESTVVDCSALVTDPDATIVLLRPGGVTVEQLRKLCGDSRVQVDRGLVSPDAAPRAPGMKYTHYAPKAPVHLVAGSSAFIQSLVDEQHTQGKRVGVLSTVESKASYHADAVVPCGLRGDLTSVANRLFDCLRMLDDADVDVIYSEVFQETGIGHAVMNRLGKAAGHRLITEPQHEC